MKKFGVRAALIAGALWSASVGSQASAATLVFGLTGSTATSGTHGNSFSQTLTQNGATVKLRASAWSLTNTSGGGTVYDSYLGMFGAGLGATSGDEDGSGSTHTIDNQNRRDFVIFQFDQAVSLTSATFTPFALGGNTTDTDFTVASGTTLLPWNTQPGLDGQTNVQLAALFNGGSNNYLGGSSTSTMMLNPSNAYGNVWLVGASFANQNTIDSFKLSQLRIQTAPIPEAATWIMMIAGFGVAGVAMRRRNATRTAIA